MPKIPIPTSFEETSANVAAQAQAFGVEWHRQAIRAAGLEPFYGEMIGNEVRFLGVIPPGVVARTAIRTEACILLMSAEQERGHVEKRGGENPSKSDLILLHSVESLQSVVLVSPSKTKANHFELLCRLPNADAQYVRMVIKFVPATRSASQRDEWWYSSSYRDEVPDSGLDIIL
jgi:hypothetical protein